MYWFSAFFWFVDVVTLTVLLLEWFVELVIPGGGVFLLVAGFVAFWFCFVCTIGAVCLGF